MIDPKRYNDLKQEYGNSSSWTIWEEEDDTPKSNTGNMSIFTETIYEQLNDKYVFVGLNVSSTPDNTAWKNFHSDSPYQNDYKLRYALSGTKFWGSYITDIIKDCPQVKSSEVRKYLRKNPQIIDDNLADF